MPNRPTRLLVLLPVLAAATAGIAAGQDAPYALDEQAVHYTLSRSTTLYSASDSTRPYVDLGMAEPVWVVENGGRWARVRTRDGAHGQVRSHEISNVWMRISKSRQTLFVYRGGDLMARLPIDMGYNFFADKEKRGNPNDPDHWRTPEGTFRVVSKNPRSQFYKAFVLNYPTEEDAERGLADGLISADEFRSIVQANRTFAVPPMGTLLGGWIEVHGNGTGQRSNWTQGCVAITDGEMDALWDLVHVGTPVVIER